MAVDLARRQDGAHLAGQAAQVARELRGVLAELREEFPADRDADALDELRARRQQRGAS
jgi:hypothetical protein